MFLSVLSEKNRRLFLSLILLFLGVSVYSIILHSDMIIGNVVIYDDLIHIPQLQAGESIGPPSLLLLNEVYHFFYFMGGKTILGMRLVMCFSLGLESALLALVLYRLNIPLFVSILAAILGFCGYHTIAQTSFITGSYYHGLFFIFIAILLLLKPYKTKLHSYFWGVIAGSLFSIAKLTGQMYVLAPFCLFMMPDLYRPFAKSEDNKISDLVSYILLFKFIDWQKALPRLVVPLLSAGIINMIVYLNYNTSYHYLNQTGLVFFNISNALSQTQDFLLWFLIAPLIIFFSLKGTIIFFILAIAMFFIVRKKLSLLIAGDYMQPRIVSARRICLSLAILTFIPFAALTFIYDYYYFIPGVFIVVYLVLISFSFYGERKMLNLSSILISILFSSLISGAFILHKSYFMNYPDVYRNLGASLKFESENWKENPQIIIISDELHVRRGLTSGYNHWSSGYIWMQTGRLDAIAILGNRSSMNNDPIVDVWRLQGEEYSYINDGGRSARVTMRGLLWDRPTYAYIARQDGSLSPIYNLEFNTNEGVMNFTIDDDANLSLD